MSIVETKIVTRSSTSKPFFTDVDPKPAVFQNIYDQILALVESNKCSRVTSTLSHDGLVQTNVRTYSDLATYGQVDTLFSIAFEHAIKQYYNDGEEFNYEMLGHSQQFQLTGIDNPFTVTTTYTYNPATVASTYPLFDSFISVIESSDKLTSFVNTGTQLIAVHTFSNSEDFSENHMKDYQFVDNLYAAGITRTVSYAMVS